MGATHIRLTGPMPQRLRQARLAAGRTQQEIADAVGAALKTINNYENEGYKRNRKVYIVRGWAEATGRTFEELWGEPDEGVPPELPGGGGGSGGGASQLDVIRESGAGGAHNPRYVPRVPVAA